MGARSRQSLCQWLQGSFQSTPAPLCPRERGFGCAGNPTRALFAGVVLLEGRASLEQRAICKTDLVHSWQIPCTCFLPAFVLDRSKGNTTTKGRKRGKPQSALLYSN